MVRCVQLTLRLGEKLTRSGGLDGQLSGCRHRPVGPGQIGSGLTLKKESEFSQISRKHGVKSHAGFGDLGQKQQKGLSPFQRLS